MDMSIHFPNLGLDFGYVGRSVRVLGFEITFYGILIALGMIIGIWFMILEVKRSHEDVNAYLGMTVTAVLTGMLGARLYYVAFSWNMYRGNLNQILSFRSGGVAFYGGLFGGILGALIYCGIRRLSFMKMADSAVVGILAAQIIGRWGDFFNRESFGGYTNSVLAMQLPLSAVRSSTVTPTIRENLETVGGSSFIQVHPVFLYESIWCLLLLMLVLVWNRRKIFHGEVFLRYLTFYGLGRFFFEWLRTDKLMIPGTPLGISQVVSMGLLIICGIIVTIRHSMAKKREELKKRRREREYAAQEERSVDRAGERFASGTSAGDPENAENTGSETGEQGGSAEKPENQSEN